MFMGHPESGKMGHSVIRALLASALLCMTVQAATAHEGHETFGDNVAAVTKTPEGVSHNDAGILSAVNHDGPKTASHLTIGIWNTASNITTYTIGNSWNDWVLYLVLDKLMEPSPYKGKARNWLATEVKQVSPDARVWEAEIRQGVKWQDGTDLTAEDVKFTYDYYREGPVNRWTHHVSANPLIDKIEVVGPYRVRFTAPRPMPNFDLVTAPELPIIEKKQWENIKDPRTLKDPPVGTGPYKLADYKADEYYHLVANENYWAGKPTVDDITLVMIKDEQAMFAALKSGDIDAAARAMPPELVDAWKNDPNIEIAQAPSLWGVWMNFNLNEQVFNNRELRHALSLAIDGNEMVDKIMLGRAQSGKHGWPHLDSVWTKPGMKVPFDDPDAAKELDAIGFKDANGDGFRDLPDGTPFDWRIVVSTNQAVHVRAAELMQKQLATIGIKTHVQAVDQATFDSLNADGNYELSISEITPHGLADQEQYMNFYEAAPMKKLLKDEPERLALYDAWWKTSTRDDRLKASFALQEYENEYPSRFMLWYPDGLFAYRWQSYDNYASSFGYGIFNKYSFLPETGREGTTDPLAPHLGQ
jgi:peptide/nickel transport system substrate-binding protein